MKQKALEFPQEVEIGTKYLVYSSVRKSRTYLEVDDDSWFAPTKTETKYDEQLVGVVDNAHDVELMGKFVKKKAGQNCYEWTVDEISFRAISIEHFQFT